MINMKRFIALLLVFCIAVPTVFAEENRDSIWDSVGGWINQAAKDTSDWTSQALNDAGTWAGQAWQDSSAWVINAWDNSSKWIEQAWNDSGNWISTNWDNFSIWINTVTTGNPYTWINDMVGEDGLLAYNTFASLRIFLTDNPDLETIHSFYIDSLSELSLLTEDKETIWSTIQLCTEAKGLPMEQTTKLLLPFVCRLLIRGSSAIGEDVVLSGPVVAKYLLTILESMNLDSVKTEEMTLKNFLLFLKVSPVLILLVIRIRIQ